MMVDRQGGKNSEKKEKEDNISESTLICLSGRAFSGGTQVGEWNWAHIQSHTFPLRIDCG